MQPSDFKTMFSALSAPRVNAYKHYFGTSLSDDQIFGCYQWNESVSHSFFKLISLIEIVMRNQMHCALSKRYHTAHKKLVTNFKNSSWPTTSSTTMGNQTSCNWYNSEVGGQMLLNRKSMGNIHSVIVA